MYMAETLDGAYVCGITTEDTRCDQKVLSLIHFKAFHKRKSLFSLSFYLIECHLESKKHLVTLDCFCTTVLREDSASNLQNGEN